MEQKKPRTIVFIHGMYMTPLCWEKWIPYFESRGYTCIAPAWPGRDRPVEILRNPDPQLGNLTLKAVVDSVADRVRTLSEKPVLIGHSMGGLVVQILLQRDIAVAGVAIDSAPPLGVLTLRPEFLKSNWPHINPFVSQAKPVQMPFERFQYTFVNGLPMEEQRAAYDRYVVPESRRVPAGSLTGLAMIDFHRAHVPLLLIAGGNDHLIPDSLNKSNFNKYADGASRTDFQEFPGRTHFIIGQAGWEEVAAFVAGWMTGL